MNNKTSISNRVARAAVHIAWVLFFVFLGFPTLLWIAWFLIDWCRVVLF